MTTVEQAGEGGELRELPVLRASVGLRVRMKIGRAPCLESYRMLTRFRAVATIEEGQEE